MNSLCFVERRLHRFRSKQFFLIDAVQFNFWFSEEWQKRQITLLGEIIKKIYI